MHNSENVLKKVTFKFLVFPSVNKARTCGLDVLFILKVLGLAV